MSAHNTLQNKTNEKAFDMSLVGFSSGADPIYKESIYPAERWARARIYGEEVNVRLRQHATAVLQQSGYKALAPMLSDQWENKKSDTYAFASTGSERHAAYAAGYGFDGYGCGLCQTRVPCESKIPTRQDAE